MQIGSRGPWGPLNSYEETQMLTKDKAVEELMQEDGYECKNIIPSRAERIVQEITKTARMLSRRGYKQRT